jgi:hypothetical protein
MVRAAADIESVGNADVRRRSGSGEVSRSGEVKMDRREVPRGGALARVRHQRAPVGADLFKVPRMPDKYTLTSHT